MVALPLFLGLVIYQTKAVKEETREAALNNDAKAAGRIAILGAVGLYLSFLIIFLILLRIINLFSDD